VVLVRTPYGRGRLSAEVFAAPLARHGLTVLMQSTRGTAGSGGLFRPFTTEREDGLATLAWLRDQPWCDGRVASAGPSYLGHTQWSVAPFADPPVVAVCAGLKLVFSGIFGKKKPAPVEVEIHIGSGGANTAVFSGSEINYSGQEFTGTELTAIFGGIDCDLRGAIIEKDCRIQITSVFGGIDLYMPENVNVSTNVTGIFGGADSKVSHKHDGPTVYIEGVCIFGGVDIQ
jgi:hypothetical protein